MKKMEIMGAIFIVFFFIIVISIKGVNALSFSNLSSGSNLTTIPWGGVTSSSSGQYLAAIPTANSQGDIYTSNDYGANWVDRTTGTSLANQTWQSIGSSSTGQYILANNYSNGNLYLSSDYGSSWSNISASSAFANNANSLYPAISSSGQYIAVAVNNGDIFVSNNYGSSWVNETSGSPLSGDTWSAMAISESGQYMTTTDGTDIYVSSNYGVNWTNETSSTIYSGSNFSYLGVSGTGQYMVALAYHGGVFKSSNYGVTWTNLTSGTSCFGAPWSSVAISANGQYMILADGGSSFLISSGCSTITGTLSASSVTNQGNASPSGMIISHSHSIGDLFLSSNYGVSFNNITNGTNYANIPYYDVTMSSNGQIYYSTSANPQNISGGYILSNYTYTPSSSSTGSNVSSSSPSSNITNSANITDPSTGYGKPTSKDLSYEIGLGAIVILISGIFYLVNSKKSKRQN